MSSAAKTILKIFLVGLAATIVRIIGQLSIPAGEQTVLAPSVFAQNGTMPLAFTIYGVFAYSLIASLFLLIRNRLGGNRIWQGLKYGLSCCAVWIVYLWEPLPHVAALDRITYPLADSLALLVMGLLLGWLLGKPEAAADRQRAGLAGFLAAFPVLPALAVAVCFFAGRMAQYIPDLVLRTFIDILAVTAGCLAFSNNPHVLRKMKGGGEFHV